jgi:acyl carrier protein
VANPNPDRQEIERKVIELAAKQGGVEPTQVTRESHFINDLNYDSLDMVEFTMELEDGFGITVPDEEAEKVAYVGQVVDFVVTKLQEAPAK